MSANASVLVVGAAGFFGRLLVEELEQFAQCKIIVAGRDTEALRKIYADRHEIMRVDLHDEESIEAALAKSNIAICAAGPFQHLPLRLPKLCTENGIPYIDISDSREFVLSVMLEADKWERRAPICTGWSAVPALSAVLTALCQQSTEPCEEIHIAIAPGNRAPRSYATVASLLESADKTFSVITNGIWREVKGFQNHERSISRTRGPTRIGYLVDVPDHTLFPKAFLAKTVEFRVGAELQQFNEMLSFVVENGIIKNLSSHARVFQKLSMLLGWLGTDSGALGVEVTKRQNGKSLHSSASIVADHHGHKIPVMPAIIMTKRFLQKGITDSAWINFATWINKDDLEKECALRGYRLHLQSW